MPEVAEVQIQLGDRTFVVRTAPFVRSSPWRKRFLAEVKPLFEQLANAQNLRFETPADLLQLWPVAEGIFHQGLDKIFELLVSYSADLEAERDWIANNATDMQILAGFQEVIQLADPLQLTKFLGRQTGLMMSGLSSRSQSASGDLVTPTPPSE